MTSRGAARLWHAAVALTAGVGTVWQLSLTLRGITVLTDDAGNAPSYAARVLRFFSYFTIQSNVLVAIASVALALRPDRDGSAFRVLRLMALVGITVTGVIYVTILRDDVHLHGAAAATNALLHYLAPTLTVLGWLLFGPRPRIDRRTLAWCAIWPVAYIAYTLMHGALADWYPYPFTDVVEHGYAVVLRNGLGVLIVLTIIGALFLWLDGALHRAPARARAVAP